MTNEMRAVKEMNERAEGREKLQAVIAENLDRLNAAIDAYQQQMNAQAATMNALNGVKMGLDLYIRRHCVLSGMYRGNCQEFEESFATVLTITPNGGSYSGTIQFSGAGEQTTLPLLNVALNGSTLSFSLRDTDGEVIPGGTATVSDDYERLTNVSILDEELSCSVLTR